MTLKIMTKDGQRVCPHTPLCCTFPTFEQKFKFSVRGFHNAHTRVKHFHLATCAAIRLLACVLGG